MQFLPHASNSVPDIRFRLQFGLFKVLEAVESEVVEQVPVHDPEYTQKIEDITLGKVALYVLSHRDEFMAIDDPNGFGTYRQVVSARAYGAWQQLQAPGTKTTKTPKTPIKFRRKKA